MTRRRVTALLLLAGSISGCGSALPPVPKIETLEAWRAYSDALDPRLSDLATFEGKWSMGDAWSTFTRWSEADTLVAIHESMSLGDYGERRVRYYFTGGALRYVREEGRVLTGAAGGELKRLDREILFAADGRLSAALNRIDGRESALDPLLASGVREHAHVLRDVDAPALTE